jgi:hypothetical protein
MINIHIAKPMALTFKHTTKATWYTVICVLDADGSEIDWLGPSYNYSMEG